MCLCKTRKIGQIEEFFQSRTVPRSDPGTASSTADIPVILYLYPYKLPSSYRIMKAVHCAVLWHSSVTYVCGNGRIASSREKVAVKPPNTVHSSLLDITELEPESLWFLVSWKSCTWLQSVTWNYVFGQDEEYFPPLAVVQVSLSLLHPETARCLNTTVIILPHCPLCSEQILPFQWPDKCFSLCRTVSVLQWRGDRF